VPFDLAPILDWISAHPHWAGLVVFCIAAAESLAVVGLFLPGAVLMFGIGALVGSGALPVTPVLLWAAAGAVVGDGVSFWLGWHFRERLLAIWPFTAYPSLVQRSTDFFHRHGGKGVLFGRFIGPIRPVIPAVAGMLGMAPSRFLAVNVISGLLWAPVYVIPGAVFAASLGLAAEVATRLAFLAGLLLLLIVLAVWAVRRGFELLHPRAHGIIVRVLAWSRLHPLLGRLPAALLDPEHPETRGLTLLALLLILAAALFLTLLENVAGGGLLHNYDAFIYFSLEGLRSPVADRALVLLHLLGRPPVLGALVVNVTLWLAWRRRWRAAAHWVGAVGFALALTWLLQLTGLGERPAPLLAGASDRFPSGTAMGAMLVYGFLGVLIARELRPTRRWLIYASIAALITAIGFAKVYLGIAWFSDVVGGLALGFTWVALLGIAYRRHAVAPLSALTLGGVALATQLLAGGWQFASHFQADLARYQPQRETTQMAAQAWWNGGYNGLPNYRRDLRDDYRQPLTLQYAGPLEPLVQHLLQHGWQRSTELTATSWLHWLANDETMAKLPVLPQVHDGRHEQLALLYPIAGEQGAAYILRLWRADLQLMPQAAPLWVGSVSRLEVKQPWGLASIPLTAGEYASGIRLLRQTLAGFGQVAPRARACCPLLLVTSDKFAGLQ